MSLTSEFLVYVTAFRLAIIAAGVVSINLGYRLFVRGVFVGGGPENSVDIKAAGSSFTLKNAAPGTSFALFGVVLITAMLIQGNPQLTYETMQKAAGAESGATSTKLELRGTETPGTFSSLVDKGADYEKAGDSVHAVEAYKQALSELAAPMNQLAWLYLQQAKTDEALPLARVAADINPENAAILDTLAEILARRGERAEAVKWMEKAASMDSRYRTKLTELKQAAR
jgi:tetratricopeptide (TPR) repeat protein